MTRPSRGGWLILLGIVMLLGSFDAIRQGATPTMSGFNFAFAGIVLLWGISRRLETSSRA